MGVDVGHVPSGPGESSQVAQAQAPHIEDQDVDDGSESMSLRLLMSLILRIQMILMIRLFSL